MRVILAAALLGLLALPAKADIVDSGSLQIGGQGVIGGTLTVQGNALGVAGAVSATSATLSGSGATTFSLTTSSGIHMLNGFIEWPDGTRTKTAGLSSAHVSSTQAFADATFTSSVFGVCFSTVQIVADGASRVRIGAAGMWKNAYGQFTALNVLQDGLFVSPFTSSLGVVSTQGQYGEAALPLSINLLLPAPTAGAHDYCLTGRVAGGTGAIWCDAVGYNKCQFSATLEK